MILVPHLHDIDLLASDLERSPGLHASTIFGELFEDLDPKRYVYDGPPNPVSLAMGTAWENHLEYLLLKNGVDAVRPGEFLSPPLGRKRIRVAYSPDLIIANGLLRCGEIKWTSKSAKGLPEAPSTFLPPKYDKNLCQLMLYIFWLREEFQQAVQGWLALALMWQSWDPQFRAYNIDFTDRELQENFDMCLNYAVEKGLL